MTAITCPPSALVGLHNIFNNNLLLMQKNEAARWSIWMGGNPTNVPVSAVEYDAVIGFLSEFFRLITEATECSFTSKEEMLLSLLTWYLMNPTTFNHWFNSLGLRDISVPTGDPSRAISRETPLWSIFSAWTSKEA